MSGNDSPIPGNATVKIEQLQSFTSLQSQVTSPQRPWTKPIPIFDICYKIQIMKPF